MSFASLGVPAAAATSACLSVISFAMSGRPIRSEWVMCEGSAANSYESVKLLITISPMRETGW